MAEEGMVHALRQIRRVLKPGGTLVDIRPDRFRTPRQRRPTLPLAYWRANGRDTFAGTLAKTPETLRRHRAATRALQDAVQSGAFMVEATEMFTFRYHFRDLAALVAFSAVAWRSTIVPDDVRTRITALQRKAPRGELILTEPLRLNVLRKA